MTKEKLNISLTPYRGTKDYLPSDWRIIQWIFAKWRETAEAFGYEEYSSPILESYELYAAKTSEEIINEQLFSFEDLGGRRLVIRPETTPSLARIVANKGKGMRQPIRLCSIGTCMRFERPQRGRSRQFEQFNLDILGGSEKTSDIEVLSTILLLMDKMNVPSNLFEIRINHRQLTSKLLYDYLKISRNTSNNLLRILDGFNKMTLNNFKDSLYEHGLNIDQIENLVKFMQGDERFIEEHIVNNFQEYRYMVDLIEKLRQNFGEKKISVKISPEIMRGFDYYTGVVFEVFDISPENRRALFGGGRYDNLVGALSNFQISGVGFGVSEVSIYNFLETHKLLPSLNKKLDFFAFVLKDEFINDLSRLCMSLRLKGKKVELYPSALSVGKGLKIANEIGAENAMFIGEDEYKSNSVILKDLRKQEQVVQSFSDILSIEINPINS